MIASQGGIYPQSVADDIHVWDLLQRLCGTDEDIATRYQCMQLFRSFLHDARIEGQLQG